jgi:hypothetical protein
MNDYKINYNILNPLQPPNIIKNKYFGVKLKNEKPFINPSNTKKSV